MDCFYMHFFAKYRLVVYIVRLQVPMKMRGWSLIVNSTGSVLALVLTWPYKVDHEAPPTRFRGHYKAHNIYYSCQQN